MLSFLSGARIYPAASGRWNPYLELMAGIRRITLDRYLPPDATGSGGAAERWIPESSQTDAFAVAVGGGLEVVLGRVVAVRVAEVRYSQSWTAPTGPASYSRALRLSSGVSLRLGTW